MTVNNRSDIDWAPKVSLSKIRLLYLREAQGICEDELIEDVGSSLYFRCASILEYTEAVINGQVKCKRCAVEGRENILMRKSMKPAELLKCLACGWQIRWRVYVKEAERVGNLYAGHARAAFERYAKSYPNCPTARERIVAIDQLIHEFHWITLVENKPPKAAKSAGMNLLQGTATQVLELLNELTYGKDALPELLEMKEWWLSQRSKGEKLKDSEG